MSLPSSQPFKVYTAAELIDLEVEHIDWTVELLLARGDFGILSGPPKESGKSTLTAALGVAVAQGRPFLGYPTKRVGVLILALEEGAGAVKRRLLRFGMQPNDPIYTMVGRGTDPSQIRRMLDAYPDVGLVILDTLTRYWVNKIDDENSNTQVARVTAPLLEITRERGVTLLMIHHDRKNIESQGSPRNIRGAGDLFGVVDQAWLLSPGIGTQRKLRIVGRYQDQSPLMLTIALGDDDYQRVRVEGEAAGRQDAVWNALPDSGGRTEEELIAATGLGKKPLKAAIEALAARVVRSGEGVRGKPYHYCRAASRET